MKFISVIILLIFSAKSSFGQNCISCKDLNIIDAVKNGVLSEDLAIVDVNAKILACPKFLHGDSTLCGSKPKVAQNGWDTNLPNDLMWTLFFSKNHYEYSKDVLHNDFFIESMSKIPEPSNEAINWFRYNWHFFTTLLPIEDTVKEYEGISELDMIQRKMISVFFQIKSWTFCPELKIIDGNFTVHGIYDKEHNIILYKNACLAKHIYRSNIKNMALAFKFHFVGAHELSHVIDDLNGSLNYDTDERRIECEMRANLNGLIITKALCRLFNSYFEHYKLIVHKNFETAKKCDIAFIDNVVSKWKDIEMIFDKEIFKAEKRIGNKTHKTKLKKSEWSEWGCIEQL